MIHYDFKGRLNYIPGGALNVQMSAWPVGGNWWEPSGSFTCVAAYQAKGAASLAASYVNLANPGTYDAAAGSAPTFDTSYGWSFNGTGNYLTTGLAPTAFSWTYIVRFSDVPSIISHQYMIGTRNAANTLFSGLSPRFSAFSNNRTYLQGNYVTPGPAVTSGVMAVAGYQPYLDGSTDGSAITSATFSTQYAFYIGTRNENGTPGLNQFYGGRIQAIAIYSTTLDATQVSEITTNMNAL